MPIYEFNCRDCNTPFEKFVRSFSAINEVACPDCGGHHVEKRISIFASSVQGGTIPLSPASSGASCSTGGL